MQSPPTLPPPKRNLECAASKLYIICSYFKSLNFSDSRSRAIAELFRENCS